MLPRLGKDAPDEDPFLLQEGIRFVVFDALVDNKHGGGEIFSLIDLGTQFPGLTKESPILAKELRQLIIEDANQFVNTQLLRCAKHSQPHCCSNTGTTELFPACVLPFLSASLPPYPYPRPHVGYHSFLLVYHHTHTHARALGT